MGEHQANFDYTDLRRCAGFLPPVSHFAEPPDMLSLCRNTDDYQLIHTFAVIRWVYSL